MSLTATISTPHPCGSAKDARSTDRPMRPKPLIATRTVIARPPPAPIPSGQITRAPAAGKRIFVTDTALPGPHARPMVFILAQVSRGCGGSAPACAPPARCASDLDRDRLSALDRATRGCAGDGEVLQPDAGAIEEGDLVV